MKILTDNTATIAGAKGVSISHLSKNLSDLSQSMNKPAEPQKSGQEIADSIIGRLAKKD